MNLATKRKGQVMKIVIDGVEYIATPVGNKCMKNGARVISRRYEECPEFFDIILKGGFSYYEHDEGGLLDIWSTDDGKVFIAHDKEVMLDWEKEDRVFFENHYPDIRDWNLQEFSEHLQKTNCIFQIGAAEATMALLKRGSAYTYSQLAMTGNLKPTEEIKHNTTIEQL